MLEAISRQVKKRRSTAELTAKSIAQQIAFGFGPNIHTQNAIALTTNPNAFLIRILVIPRKKLMFRLPIKFIIRIPFVCNA